MKLEMWYDKMYAWLIHYGPRVLIGALVLVAGFWLIGVLSRSMNRKIGKRNVNPSVRPFLVSLLSTILRVLLILAVMQIVGIPITLFTALVAAMGVAAGLALSGTLQNFASGILILLLKPFEVGDNIVAQGFEGTVTSIQIFYTIVTTFDNRTVVLPNSKLSNEVIVNISRVGDRRLDINLKFPNSADFAKVKAIIEDTIDHAEGTLGEPKKRIGIGELQGDSYVVHVNVWVNAHGFQDVKLALQERLLERLKQAGLL